MNTVQCYDAMAVFFSNQQRQLQPHRKSQEDEADKDEMDGSCFKNTLLELVPCTCKAKPALDYSPLPPINPGKSSPAAQSYLGITEFLSLVFFFFDIKFVFFFSCNCNQKPVRHRLDGILSVVTKSSPPRGGLRKPVSVLLRLWPGCDLRPRVIYAP